MRHRRCNLGADASAEEALVCPHSTVVAMEVQCSMQVLQCYQNGFRC